MTKIAVIIVAGGQGRRAGGNKPKQYRLLAGKPLLRQTLDAVIKLLPTAQIQVVIGPEDAEPYKQATAGLNILRPVVGGTTRQESVFNGLQAISDLEPDSVLVHDAARPFISTATVRNVIASLAEGAKAVIPAVPIVDTLNKVINGKLVDRIDRQDLYSVQTPQGFAFSSLMAAHNVAKDGNATDDGGVMEAAGHRVHVCAGDENNFKITHEQDFKKAEAQVMNALGDIRTGSGYDVHRFETGDHLWLCGVKLPFTKGLRGHSDADVALHALTDALLSSVAAGDIGTHFPPSEAKWRGASSDIFIRKAAEIIQNKGGVIANVTVCIICEKPQIGPHNDVMTTRIASLLGIDVNRVSVQATTTEKLGFTGREEGITASASATVRLPW